MKKLLKTNKLLNSIIRAYVGNINVQDSIGYRQLVKSAKAGNVHALGKLYTCYFLGLDGFPVDEGEAEKWRKKALFFGYPIIPNERIVRQKFIEPKQNKKLSDEEFSNKLSQYERKAEKGDVTAQVMVARTLECSYRSNEAVKYWKMAAEKGIPEAQFIMGEAYLEGKVFPADKEESKRWLDLAAKKGYQAALAINRKDFYLNGKLKPKGGGFKRVKIRKDVFLSKSYEEAIAFILEEDGKYNSENEIKAIWNQERKILAFITMHYSERFDPLKNQMVMFETKKPEYPWIIDSEKAYGVYYDARFGILNKPRGITAKCSTWLTYARQVEKAVTLNGHNFENDPSGYAKAMEVAAEITFLLMGHDEVVGDKPISTDMKYMYQLFIPEDFGLVKTDKGYEYERILISHLSFSNGTGAKL